MPTLVAVVALLTDRQTIMQYSFNLRTPIGFAVPILVAVAQAVMEENRSNRLIVHELVMADDGGPDSGSPPIVTLSEAHHLSPSIITPPHVGMISEITTMFFKAIPLTLE